MKQSRVKRPYEIKGSIKTLRAYYWQCEKCNFGGARQTPNKFSEENNPGFDWIVKDHSEIVQCPQCEATMYKVHGPLGGLEIAPTEWNKPTKFYPYFSTTLNRKIETVEDMMRGIKDQRLIFEKSKDKVETTTDQTAKQTSNEDKEIEKPKRKRGRPPKKKLKQNYKPEFVHV